MLDIKIVVVEKLDKKQQQKVKALQKVAFKGVTEKEVEEDFYNPEVAHALAYKDRELVGWAGIHMVKVSFKNRQLKVGGFGICTHPSWQRKGIATMICKKVMKFIKSRSCDVAFLSVDVTNIASVKLHQKNGFVMLPGKFSWTNSKGKVKKGDGGMIAPVNSQKIFQQILQSKEVFYVGKGYW